MVAVPALRIITPRTTPEEVAAIVALFASMGSESPAPTPTRTWSSSARALGIIDRPDAGAWRTSALPR